jgi:hypothetical protein
MPYTALTKPAQGDGTRLSFASTVIDDLAYFQSIVASIGSQAVPNGSFEFDGNSDGIPDEWTKTLFTGGSFLLDTTTYGHGIKSVKFTSPGGSGNGGGYLESADYFEVTPLRLLALSWLSKSSVAGVRNIVGVRFYDATRAFISQTNIFDSASNNPGVWAAHGGSCLPPSTAYYAKLRITGCDSTNTTAGSAWFDDVRLSLPAFTHRADYTTAGTYVYRVPAGVYCQRIRCTGGGGGGGAYSGTPTSPYRGGGGGAGGYAESWVQVVPGSTHTIVVGAGGTSAASSDGGNGGDSTWDSTVIIGNGGAKGLHGTGAIGASGAGGAATGIIAQTGESGAANGSTNNSDGGGSFAGGLGGAGAVTGNPGAAPGGGGGGSSGNAAGGLGGSGVVIIESI